MGIRPTTRTTRTTTTSAVTATAEPRTNTYCKMQEECIFARRQVEYSQTVSFQKIIESICTPHARNGLQACSLFICFSLSLSYSLFVYVLPYVLVLCTIFFILFRSSLIFRMELKYHSAGGHSLLDALRTNSTIFIYTGVIVCMYTWILCWKRWAWSQCVTPISFALSVFFAEEKYMKLYRFYFFFTHRSIFTSCARRMFARAQQGYEQNRNTHSAMHLQENNINVHGAKRSRKPAEKTKQTNFCCFCSVAISFSFFCPKRKLNVLTWSK